MMAKKKGYVISEFGVGKDPPKNDALALNQNNETNQ